MRGLVPVLLVAASVARADVPSPTRAALAVTPAADTRADARHAELVGRYRSAVLRRNFGVGLGAIGLTALAAGVALVGYGLYDVPPSTAYDTSVTFILSGIASAAIGLVVGGTGAYLAIDGQNRMTEAQWRMGILTWVAPRSDGVTVGITARF